jgi:hypothetical protein
MLILNQVQDSTNSNALASASAIKRRVGVAPGYPPVGAAHCAPKARTLRLPHVFSRGSHVKMQLKFLKYEI